MADNNGVESPKQDKPEQKRAWGDEEEEPDQEEEAPIASSSSSSSAPAVDKNPDLNIDSVSISGVPPRTGLLEEPDDSAIRTVTSGDTLYSSASTFEDLNLSPELIRGLYAEMRFSQPSKIQAVTLPMILTPPFKNLIAQAHNGSGKTTCFVLGMLSRVDPKNKAPQALCICPTRELAIQNQGVLLKMGKYTGITSMCAVPMDSTNYIPIAKRPPITEHVVIGTPGTIKKWMSSRKLSTRDIKILVFDEADHMLAEDGFRDDSLRIMKDIERNSSHCQVLLFSATFNETVKEFVSRAVKDGNQLFVRKEELSLDAVKQYKVYCPDELAKIKVIKDKIFELARKWGQTIVFVRTRNSAMILYKELENFGYDCTCIHGALQQDVRDKMVQEFKDGLTKVLISTDLLARGFDQQQVNLVVNYDLPVKHDHPSEPDYEVYLHRIGRAGRFGRKGAVFNLICTDRDNMIMDKIEKHFEHQVATVPNWESDEDFEAALKESGLL
ncbi:P-loop containing nucleoside triphosphate hydrolases superfamily protein [Tasmannia lanceolata]|uniref:P-loop containing nucleoside triphosphate hydrolases superfamily protein n=1 Tax=Tasmannia lanceolata TaxID=3420 RepID=UPI0040647064